MIDAALITPEMLASADRIETAQNQSPTSTGKPATQAAKLIDFLTAPPAERDKAMREVFLVTERAIRIWGLSELMPCWPLHADVTLTLYHLERTWHHYHHDGAERMAEANGFSRVHLPAARAAWRESPMAQCDTGHPETPRWEPAHVTEARRANYQPAPESYATSWPVTDPSGRAWEGET